MSARLGIFLLGFDRFGFRLLGLGLLGLFGRFGLGISNRGLLGLFNGLLNRGGRLGTRFGLNRLSLGLLGFSLFRLLNGLGFSLLGLDWLSLGLLGFNGLGLFSWLLSGGGRLSAGFRVFLFGFNGLSGLLRSSGLGLFNRLGGLLRGSRLRTRLAVILLYLSGLLNRGSLLGLFNGLLNGGSLLGLFNGLLGLSTGSARLVVLSL